MKGESVRGYLGWPKGGYFPNPDMDGRFESLLGAPANEYQSVMRETLPSRLTT